VTSPSSAAILDFSEHVVYRDAVRYSRGAKEHGRCDVIDDSATRSWYSVHSGQIKERSNSRSSSRRPATHVNIDSLSVLYQYIGYLSVFRVIYLTESGVYKMYKMAENS